MKTLRDSIAQRASRPAIAAAMILAAALAAGAQDSPQSGEAASADDDLFGTAETVTQAATTSQEAENKSGFLKYDQVKVGGSFTGKLGYNAVYADAWGDGAGSLSQFLSPTQYYLSPDVEGKVTIVAKPSTDFGVNMEFRESWPFSKSGSYLTGATYSSDANAYLPGNQPGVTTTSSSITIPNIAIWSVYSKFNWNDRAYFSFGKQPLSWGVSKGAFQPADDIFAVSSAIDLTDTSAEREGPISLKATVPLGMTNNFYFYTGLPTNSDGSTKVDPADTRLAAKAELGFGNTELALAGYYAYNDHPRALLMGTTSLGSWNIFGEGVLKYGSERYFISETDKSLANLLGLAGSKKDDQFWFTGTAGGYYSDSDSGLTIMLQYLFNGEAQTAITAQEAYSYYVLHSTEADRIKLGEHYGFVSISDSNLLPGLFGKDKLGASLIAISNLSDLSGYVMPSLSYTFFDYMILKVGATVNFGEKGDEYILYGVGQSLSSGFPTTAGAALTASLTIGTGSF